MFASQRRRPGPSLPTDLKPFDLAPNGS